MRLFGAGLVAAPVGLAVLLALPGPGAPGLHKSDTEPQALEVATAPAADPDIGPRLTASVTADEPASLPDDQQARAAKRAARVAERVAQRAAARAERSVLSRSRSRAPGGREWLATCTVPSDVAAIRNGAIPDEYLCEPPGTGHRLVKDAARAWARLSRRYVDEFDEAPCITDSYRSLGDQTSLFSTKPGLAARPGTSNHGWGLALDLCGGAELAGSNEHEWLIKHGARHGWLNPEWARPGGSRPEPWHWEYAGP